MYALGSAEPCPRLDVLRAMHEAHLHFGCWTET